MKTVKSILIFSAAFLSVVIFFEIFLSYAGILSPVVRIDLEKGERYVPNKMCSSSFVSEGFGLAETNSSGWFGKDFKDEGPDDISIAVLGNSFVAGRHVFYRQNFLSMSENYLNQKLSNKKASFFNFGKEDFPLRELLYVKEDIMKTHHPDYFLVLINPGALNYTSKQRYVAFYDYVNGQFQVDSSFKKSSFVKNYSRFQFFTKSSVLFLGHRAKNQLPNAGEILFDKFYISGKKIEPEEEPVDTITVSDAAILKELSKDPKVIFILNLDPALAKTVRPLISKSLKIDLWPPLLAMQKNGDDPYYWPIPDKHGHWNIKAHELIGKVIAGYMSQIIQKKS
jgi:hypothetical protein